MAHEDILEQPLSLLPSTSSLTIKRLQRLGLHTWRDLINYFPTRYEHYEIVSSIANAQLGEMVTLRGKIKDCRQEITRRGLKIQRAVLEDNSGEIELIWYNQPYLLNLFKTKSVMTVAGEIKKYASRRVMEPASYEILKSEIQPLIHTGRLIPIYPEKIGLSSRTIREKIFYILSQLKANNTILEWLPEEIVVFNQLISENTAYQEIHFPSSIKEAQLAKKRLSFDELFIIQLSSAIVRQQWRSEKVSAQMKLTPEIASKMRQFINSLPFTLTASQLSAWEEILQDLQQDHPMNRLLQGNVGSGKTVIGAISAYFVHLNGFQTLMMAPTEILAQQHYQTVTELLKNFNLRIALQTGAIKHLQKERNSQFPIIIGTHALLNKKLHFDSVGLVIIDEQHRFGVAQRSQLKTKGINPHLLTMTATPIPRTVALTLYGELDLSIIQEMPHGRLAVKTYIISQQKRQAAYDWIRKQIITQKVQAFIVCPLIDESAEETMQTVKAAKKEYEFLKNIVFPDLRVALIHGKLKTKEKEAIMQSFRQGWFDILVTTSVVEVGIDIPNATIMIIEGAERFGLAQLHQLRGRVGRGQQQSYCLLFTSNEEERNQKRLKFFASNHSGLAIAEYDFRRRGPGQLFGLKQHGFNELKLADLTNLTLIKQTKNAVSYFIHHHKIVDFPELRKRLDRQQIKYISRD